MYRHESETGMLFFPLNDITEDFISRMVLFGPGVFF